MSDSHNEILRLMNDYCYRIDAGDLDGFADLFKHGSWSVLDGSGAVDNGSEAVRHTIQNVILYDGKPNTKHVMTNVQIEIDEPDKVASAQCYITVLQSVPPDFPLQMIFSGHYHDRFERVGGHWYFKLREISPDLIGDLTRHRADMSS